jgi:hypothetical protein
VFDGPNPEAEQFEQFPAGLDIVDEDTEVIDFRDRVSVDLA